MRIYITGPAGSGKSTLAQQLWTHYDIPVVHLDELMWKPGLMESEEYRILQAQEISKDVWIIEWSSVSILRLMAHRVDRVIILNTPPIGNMLRIIMRFLKSFLWEKRVGFNSTETQSFPFKLLLKTAIWRKKQLPRIRFNIQECSLWERVLEVHSIENVFEKIVTMIDLKK